MSNGLGPKGNKGPGPGPVGVLIPTHKKCCHCKIVKVISAFYKNKSMPDGHALQCITCTRDLQQKSYRTRKDPQNVMDTLTGAQPPLLPRGYKRCSNPYCSRIRLATSKYFRADSRNSDGFTCRCKRCLLIVEHKKRLTVTVNTPPETLGSDGLPYDPVVQEILDLQGGHIH